MFVKPSNGPAAARKAAWEAQQKANNAAAKAKVIASLAKPLDITRTPECSE